MSSQDEVSDQIRLYIKGNATPAIPFLTLGEQTGLMRTLMIRTSSTETMVVLVFAYEDEGKSELRY